MRPAAVTISSTLTQSGEGNGLATAPIPLGLAERANLPKLPLLPVSKDLIFYGEGT